MKTPNVNSMSESESWICHQLCSGFFAYFAMDCCVDLLETAKNIAVFGWFDTIIEGQEFSTVIPAVALRKSQLLKLRLVFYLLTERLSMFSAKLKAFESILLLYSSLHFLAVPVCCDDRVYLKGLHSKPPFVRYRQICSWKVKPPLLRKFLVMPLIKQKHLDFFMWKLLLKHLNKSVVSSHIFMLLAFPSPVQLFLLWTFYQVFCLLVTNEQY